MKKLIAAVEALPGSSRRDTRLVVLADVLRLVREHDPTAAIVAWIRKRGAEEGAIGNDAIDKDLEYEAMRRTGCEDMANVLADELESGKAKL